MLLRLAVVVPVLMSASEYQPRTVKDPAGRYYGLKQVGTDPYGYQMLELVIDAKGNATLTWSRRDQTDVREKKELTLSDVKIDVSGFTANVVGTRPKEVPAKLNGKFVTKYPPGKGEVRDGILFPGDWFLSEMKEE